MRIEEAKPVTLAPLDLKVESYELFRSIAMDVKEQLDIRKSRDPEAGLPIRGTNASMVLTPEREHGGGKARDDRKPSSQKARRAEAALAMQDAPDDRTAVGSAETATDRAGKRDQGDARGRAAQDAANDDGA